MLLSQRYTSSELFHFIGRKDPNDDARYSRLISILQSGVLNPHSTKGLTSAGVINYNQQFSGNKMIVPSMVCFCDIPLECLSIHMDKYSYFGISFSRDFLVNNGANPVFYNALKSKIMTHEREAYFNNEVKKYYEKWNKTVFTPGRSTTDPKEIRIKKEISDEFNFLIQSILGYTVFFDHEKKEDDPDNYYMEREWRVLGQVQFKITDIIRIVMPVGYLQRFNKDTPNYNGHLFTVDKKE